MKLRSLIILIAVFPVITFGMPQELEQRVGVLIESLCTSEMSDYDAMTIHKNKNSEYKSISELYNLFEKYSNTFPVEKINHLQNCLPRNGDAVVVLSYMIKEMDENQRKTVEPMAKKFSQYLIERSFHALTGEKFPNGPEYHESWTGYAYIAGYGDLLDAGFATPLSSEQVSIVSKYSDGFLLQHHNVIGLFLSMDREQKSEFIKKTTQQLSDGYIIYRNKLSTSRIDKQSNSLSVSDIMKNDSARSKLLGIIYSRLSSPKPVDEAIAVAAKSIESGASADFLLPWSVLKTLSGTDVLADLPSSLYSDLGLSYSQYLIKNGISLTRDTVFKCITSNLSTHKNEVAGMHDFCHMISDMDVVF
ncbi:hypothetical protein EOPP23_09295 [Endozoicomonas sp. OPT23]|uniref:hypothetical protein n=1 Tax=Endozoicomonas sp. OPT23 TaxID=2072845 RepID=UPI00129A9361|nr:hypothetical protein [Endozoicomonas sp. OPT23]MRI33177.1 hypothetical protein [Endozoicomonas sp. OPT23]